MRSPISRWFGVILLVAGVAEPSRAQAPAESRTDQTLQVLQSLQQRLDQLEKQNRDLQDTVRNLQNTPAPVAPASVTFPPHDSTASTIVPSQDVRSVVNDVLKEKAAAEVAAKKHADEEGHVVGSLMGLRGVWTTNAGATGYQPWFETEDKAFRIHAGARIQPDYVFGAGAQKNVEDGFGGTGPFLEGANFRRARLELDGWMHENIDFFVEYEFANGPFNTGVRPGNLTPSGTPTGTQPFTNILNQPVPTDVWISVNGLPVIGTARVGNLKFALGLDHLTGSRFLDFMERSSGFDTYYNRNNGWENGFLFSNWTEDQRATYQATITRTSNTPAGFTQGGDGWNTCLRLTALPVYIDDGRCLMHVGLGMSRKGLDNSSGPGVAILNTRWLLRNSQANLQNVVATAVLSGRDQYILNPELFVNMGPFSLQSEFIASQINEVTAWSSQLSPKANQVTPRSFESYSWYVQGLYFLTGETRPYAKTALHGPGAAPTRVVPFSNFYWLRNHETGHIWSPGAWQVGARYCYTNLDSAGINGGIINEVTLGLNWFLNPNVKFQWNYDIGHRELVGGTSSGNFQGFGMRMAMDF